MKAIREKNQWANLLKSNSKRVSWLIFAGAAADASVFPFPVMTLFLMAALLYPEKALKLTIYATLGTLGGALTGYGAGYHLFLSEYGEFSGFARFLFKYFPGFNPEVFFNFQSLFQKWNFWILFASAFSPVPLGFFAIPSGVIKLGLHAFIPVVFVSQGIKYFLLSFVVARFVPRIKRFIPGSSNSFATAKN